MMRGVRANTCVGGDDIHCANHLRLQPHIPTPREVSFHDACHSSHMRWSPCHCHFHCMLSLPSIFAVGHSMSSLLPIDLWLEHKAISNTVLACCDISTPRKPGMGDGFGGKCMMGGEIYFDESWHSAPPRPIPLTCDTFPGPPIVTVTFLPHCRQHHCL